MKKKIGIRPSLLEWAKDPDQQRERRRNEKVEDIYDKEAKSVRKASLFGVRAAACSFESLSSMLLRACCHKASTEKLFSNSRRKTTRNGLLPFRQQQKKKQTYHFSANVVIWRRRRRRRHDDSSTNVEMRIKREMTEDGKKKESHNSTDMVAFVSIFVMRREGKKMKRRELGRRGENMFQSLYFEFELDDVC